jgi:hypothetical protein
MIRGECWVAFKLQTITLGTKTSTSMRQLSILVLSLLIFGDVRYSVVYIIILYVVIYYRYIYNPLCRAFFVIRQWRCLYYIYKYINV